MAARAIKATFSDWRTVKSRKVLQLIFEVPLEQQAEALTMLGAPMPDDPAWCGIARIVEEPAPAKNPDKAEAARERYRAQDKMAQAAQRAAMLCKDMAFRRYVATRASDGTVIASEDGCAKFVRDRCRIDSRSRIASDERAYNAFLALELEFKAAQGQFAEAR